MTGQAQVPGLLQACRKVHESHSSWESLVARNSDDAVCTVLGEVSAFRNLVVTPNATGDVSREVLEPMLSTYEVTAIHLSDLAIICSQRVGGEEQLLWPSSEKSLGTLVLRALSTNLASTLFAIRQLVLTGYDGQARLLLRWFVELSDLTIAVSFDYKSYLHYLRSGGSSNYNHWRKHLSPEAIRKKVLARLDSEMGMTEEIAEFVQDTRRETYRWLSSYSHANFAAQFLSGLSPSVAERGAFLPKLSQQVDEDSKSTMFRATLYSWLTCMTLLWLFSHCHNWPSSVNNDEIRWFCYRSEVIKRLVLVNYHGMLDQINRNDG